VHKAKHLATDQAVALKRILMHNEKGGMPVTALREIKILKSLKHKNIIELLDMFVVHSMYDQFFCISLANKARRQEQGRTFVCLYGIPVYGPRSCRPFREPESQLVA
jgi:serine/threonine protein kinase